MGRVARGPRWGALTMPISFDLGVKPTTLERETGAEDRWVLNFGPQHPATHTTFRLVLELEGERVVGCIPEWEDRVLLCRRAIEPQYGLWTLPAGFMELGETATQAALRETEEEAHARVEIVGLYSVFSLPQISQVYLLLRGRLLDLDFAPGHESLEVRLFGEPEIPWDALAFDAVRETLRRYFRDRRAGGYQVQMGDIVLGPPHH